MSRLSRNGAEIIGFLTGILAGVGVLGFVVMVWRFNPILGLVVTALYVMAGPCTPPITVGILVTELLEPPDAPRPQQAIASPLAHLVGSQAKTVSVLKPGGKVQIAGERFEAKSALSLIPVGTVVRVVEATGKVLIVEEEHQGEPNNRIQPTTPGG